MPEQSPPLLDEMPAPRRWDDVRFIGAVMGRYALARRPRLAGQSEVFACRLCSIATRMAVLAAPVLGREGEGVTAHFDVFGLVRGHVIRHTGSGFAMQIDLPDDERNRLAARIRWHKQHVANLVADRREHRRSVPRDPRSSLTLADGRVLACLLIDISRSGAAISAEVMPPLGTPLAVGRVVGRVVRHFDIGFAVQFVEVQQAEALESLLSPLTPAETTRGSVRTPLRNWSAV